MRSKLVLFFLLMGHLLLGQQLGNEWINYDQSYFKIKTGTDDVHRITYQALVDAGFDVSSISPAQLQLFHRGEEVAIRTVGMDDASFDADDYIEFWGRKNDGTQDTELFYRPQHQIHKFYNMFSDTTAFFLTVGEAQGKRMQVENISPSGLPSITYHKENILQVRSEVFSFGQYYPIGNPTGEVKRSYYDVGQMFMSDVIEKTASTVANGRNKRDFVFDGITKQLPSVSKPELTFQIIGFNNIAQHRANTYVGPSQDGLQPLVQDITLSFNNFGTRENLQLNWDRVSDEGRVVFRVENVGYDEYPRDLISIGYLRLRYPREIDAFGTDKFFYIQPDASSRQILIPNVPGSPTLYDVTDYKNPKLIQGQLNANSYLAGVSGASTEKKLFLKGESNVVEAEVEAVQFKFQDISSFNYFMVSHPFLRKPVDGSYDDPIQAYIDYRKSVEGGAWKVHYADVTDLYNEFSYGEYTPLAIKRFVRKAYQEADPQYLFLIGKSRRVDNQMQRLPNPLAAGTPELVPTLGAPGSDVVYTTELDGTEHLPVFPVGRLSVTKPAEVANYLDKVIEKESNIKNSPWTKNFLQLSGGISSDELIRFREFIEDFEGIIAQDYLGAAVTNVSKTNNNAYQTINISEEINNGTGFVTFFGHSSTNYTDIDVGRVTDPAYGYDNKGRYPVMLVNGCRGGEIFYFNAFVENWMAARDKGAVNILAHSDVGIPNYLREYTEEFYEVMADTLWMTKSVGQIQKEVIKRHLQGFSINEIDHALVEQTNLQGDPAIPIFGHDKVDYIVREEDIRASSINGLPVTASTQFFNLAVVVNNAGRTTDEPVKVNVRRTLPNGQVLELPEIEVPPVRNRDTVYYEVSNQGLDVFGANIFEVTLDLNNEVDEGSEFNNTASASIFLGASGTFNTAPTNFATLDKETVELVVQSANLKANDQNFIVEIDTVDTFDSPWKQVNNLEGKGLASWEVTLLPHTLNDTIQYYWRTIFEEELLEDPQPWAVSAFTNIQNGVEGWGQTEFDQFRDLSLSSVGKDEASETWIFEGNETFINVVTYGEQHPLGGQPLNMTIEINGQSLFRSSTNGSCAPESLNLIAFDKDSGRPYLVLRTPGAEFETQDPLNCGVTPQVINRIPDKNLSTAINNDDALLKNYLDGVSTGDYVLMFSIGELDYNSWTDLNNNQFPRVGVRANDLPSVAGEPVIVYGIKGATVGTATLVEGTPAGAQTDATRTEIEFQTSIFASTDSGSVISPVIGPVSQWGSLSKRFDDNPAEDELVFEVRGRAQDGTETVLFTLNDVDELDMSSIDPQQYPYVRLFLSAKDRVSATPPQLKNWVVTYQGVPEGVLTLQNDQNERIELQNGEPFEAKFRFSNISAYSFQGQLNVNYSVTNQNTGNEITANIQIPPVAAGESVDFTVPIETEGQLGLNDFEIFVNPGDELEQYYTNNVIRLDDFLEVKKDEVNPAMDVTFDGVYIVDGDIVSPTPTVDIELRDNNPYLLKTDTTGIEISLGQICDGCTLKRINFSDGFVNYTPATENENFKIQFQPEALEDGEYMLQVNASDASGNPAGVGPYEITFEVVSESTITHFYPYPNPFSTSTRFVFTLTGSEIPDQIKIQIFTVSGKLVREITQDEIGPVRVGNNITDYAWDGRDEFGDVLANGTYIYRVQVKANGQDLGHRGTGKDKAFNNDFGKLVIIR